MEQFLFADIGAAEKASWDFAKIDLEPILDDDVCLMLSLFYYGKWTRPTKEFKNLLYKTFYCNLYDGKE